MRNNVRLLQASMLYGRARKTSVSMLWIWKWRAHDQKRAASRSQPIHCIVSAFFEISIQHRVKLRPPTSHNSINSISRYLTLISWAPLKKVIFDADVRERPLHLQTNGILQFFFRLLAKKRDVVIKKLLSLCQGTVRSKNRDVVIAVFKMLSFTSVLFDFQDFFNFKIPACAKGTSLKVRLHPLTSHPLHPASSDVTSAMPKRCTITPTCCEIHWIKFGYSRLASSCR